MKITDSSVIQMGEKELIDAITGDLDWATIERIFKDRYNLEFQEDIEYKTGDIVVHDNQIAYKLNFDVRVSLSVLFDRKGECITVTADSGEDHFREEDISIADNAEAIGVEDDPADTAAIEADTEVNENVSQMASQIADMISDINQE